LKQSNHQRIRPAAGRGKPGSRVNAAGPEGIDTSWEMAFYVKHASLSNTRQTGGARHRRKGDRIEREIVSRHTEIGIKAERYPLSGASRFRGSCHDIDLYPFGTDEGPLVAEVKSRRSGAGFVTLEKWLGEYDCLFLRRNNADPLVLLPWRVWARLLERVRR
jgi:Holliday junction resolvase